MLEFLKGKRTILAIIASIAPQYLDKVASIDIGKYATKAIESGCLPDGELCHAVATSAGVHANAIWATAFALLAIYFRTIAMPKVKKDGQF